MALFCQCGEEIKAGPLPPPGQVVDSEFHLWFENHFKTCPAYAWQKIERDPSGFPLPNEGQDFSLRISGNP